MNSAHHMLTYACGRPGSDKPFWFVFHFFLLEILKFIYLCRTGGMSCGSNGMIIHGWARNAPALTLPEGFFKINKDV